MLAIAVLSVSAIISFTNISTACMFSQDLVLFLKLQKAYFTCAPWSLARNMSHQPARRVETTLGAKQELMDQLPTLLLQRHDRGSSPPPQHPIKISVGTGAFVALKSGKFRHKMSHYQTLTTRGRIFGGKYAKMWKLVYLCNSGGALPPMGLHAEITTLGISGGGKLSESGN